MVLNISNRFKDELTFNNGLYDRSIMLDGLISNIKTRSTKMSNSIHVLRSSSNQSLENFKSKFKEPASPDYCNIEHNPLANSPSPSKTAVKEIPKKWDLKWPIIVDNKLQWVPHVPDVDNKSDSELLDRFNFITKIDDSHKTEVFKYFKYMFKIYFDKYLMKNC